MKKYLFVMAAILGVFAFGMIGCATKEYVNQQISQSLDSKVNKITQDIEANRNEIMELKNSVAAVSSNVQDALDRAEKAGKLAEGKFLYEATISDASVNFAFDKTELSEEALATLDVIAEELKKENKNVYVEIQGHTDSIGSEEYNLELGEERAENVLSYFHVEHNFPLHRMSTFSYGESQMVVDNDTAENRAENRRVTIVVME
jgi:outer membrane protein OmpA-like peptidoglycan-associated protein